MSTADQDPLARARRIKHELSVRYGSDQGVHGVGVAPRPDGFGVRVLVADAAAAAALALPSEIDGVLVDVVVVGEIRAEE